jgi:hypothetical protein
MWSMSEWRNKDSLERVWALWHFGGRVYDLGICEIVRDWTSIGHFNSKDMPFAIFEERITAPLIEAFALESTALLGWH